MIIPRIFYNRKLNDIVCILPTIGREFMPLFLMIAAIVFTVKELIK